MLNLRQLFNDGLELLGYDNPDVSPIVIRERVLADIHAALQTMQMAGEDFYCREPHTVSLTTGTGAYTIEKPVQKVLDPVRIDGLPLRKLDSRQQLIDFGPLFLGQVSRVIPNGQPLAYFVESLGDVTRSESVTRNADSVKIVLHVIPPPASNQTLTLDAIFEPPVYATSDLCVENVPVPPVPHQYHESILRPLVRMNLTTCSRFERNKEKLPQIQADYLKALTLLGLADPRTPKPAGSNSYELKNIAVAPPQ